MQLKSRLINNLFKEIQNNVCAFVFVNRSQAKISKLRTLHICRILSNYKHIRNSQNTKLHHFTFYAHFRKILHDCDN